jgi:hypothetical protein
MIIDQARGIGRKKIVNELGRVKKVRLKVKLFLILNLHNKSTFYNKKTVFKFLL